MGWQPGPDDGTGAPLDRGPGVPGGAPIRDPRLALFAGGGSQRPVPSGWLALLADELSGSERRCPGATSDELVGLLQAWATIESWAAGGKLDVIAEMIRRDAPSNGGHHGDLPDTWSPSLRHELAAALACSVQSAETSAWLAWEQQARLPGLRALLNNGVLTLPKARAVIETFKYLDDADAASAEALILDQLADKTYTQVLRLAEQAALTVDPELAERRREQAQKKDARVVFFRELSGTAGLSGRDLPPDEALAAMAAVNVRAQEYEDSRAFGDTRTDVLRAYAYVDLLSGTPAETRIARAEAQDQAAEAAENLAWAEARAAARTASAKSETDTGTADMTDAREDDVEAGSCDIPRCGCDDNCRAPADSGDAHSHGGDSHGEHGEHGEDEPDGGAPGRDGPGPGVSPAGRAVQRRPPDLVVPLATLLGLAERPGEIQGFGLLDPGLARDMAAAALVSPRTEICVTVTSPEGWAVGHGCVRISRSSQSQATAAPGNSPTGLPARLNLTVSAAALPSLNSHVGPWAFVPRGSPGPPDGYGSWTLVLPGGRRFAVRLDLVPVFECDHRYESRGYRPSDRLRHLVQVRDGACTFPSCSRHARESDFEHAVPYEKGGRTCTCNAGARSRACHRVKQSAGWNVSQPRPGFHQWQTPSGRVYVQEPWRYPA
jgi:hypothetical protein